MRPQLDAPKAAGATTSLLGLLKSILLRHPFRFKVRPLLRCLRGAFTGMACGLYPEILGNGVRAIPTNDNAGDSRAECSHVTLSLPAGPVSTDDKCDLTSSGGSSELQLHGAAKYRLSLPPRRQRHIDPFRWHHISPFQLRILQLSLSTLNPPLTPTMRIRLPFAGTRAPFPSHTTKQARETVACRARATLYLAARTYTVSVNDLLLANDAFGGF